MKVYVESARRSGYTSLSDKKAERVWRDDAEYVKHIPYDREACERERIQYRRSMCDVNSPSRKRTNAARRCGEKLPCSKGF